MEESSESQKSNYFPDSKARRIVNYLQATIIGFTMGILTESFPQTNLENIGESVLAGLGGALYDTSRGRGPVLKVNTCVAFGYLTGQTLNQYKEPLLKILSQ